MIHSYAAKRIRSIPETIFTTMSRLAVEHRAINLGQGFPDFNGPSWIMEEAFKAMQSGHNQYAPMSGTNELKNSVAWLYKKFYDLEFNAENEITITAGATEALFSSMLALINPGDEVIMFEPYYDSHHANTIIAEGIPKYITLHKPNFNFDPDELEKIITPSTKIIIINNPHNPTGKVYSFEELEQIARLAIKYNLIVISDEVYEFLTYDNVRHIPIVHFPDMRERTITISSTGKTFGMTGWKIGYAVATPELTRSIQKIHQFVTFAVNTPGQMAMAYAIRQLESYLPDFRRDYLQKRNMLYEGLAETSFVPHKPKGSYFMMIDLPGGRSDDTSCAMSLVKDHGVATIPPSVFYGKSVEGKTMLRLCFAKKESTLREGIERLKKF